RLRGNSESQQIGNKEASKSKPAKATHPGDRPKKRIRRKSKTNAELPHSLLSISYAFTDAAGRCQHVGGIGCGCGLGALRAVKAIELKEAGRNGVRGPENKTLQHWHNPTPILDRLQKEPHRWEFGCKYCNAVRTFPRTKGVNLWEEESNRPVLGNLATHTKKHEAKIAIAASSEPSTAHHTHGFTAASAKLMEGYLKDGALNPRLVPTQTGFLKMFAAWLLEDDLAWTTGESPGLARLFKYMQVNFKLPSDTTVRNTVARICQDLHKVIVEELASVKSKISYSQDTWTTKQMVFSFAGVIASFIDDDWNLIERLIDFRRLNPEDHKGKAAAKTFIRSARKRGRLDLISPIPPTLTMDNATSNDVLARSLATLLVEWHRWCSGEGGGNLERPLIWWKEHAAGFPVMALVARDFLAIQGSAVSVERLFKQFLYVNSVKTSKVIKKFKAKNIQIRKCMSSNRGFCWVDSDGRFWQWSYGPSEEPEQVFTLHARAPRYWFTPITTPDGEWYVICATEKDKRRGVVHCFPSDHGEARIFDGPAAATFAFVGNSERRGGRAKELAILLLRMVHDRDGSNIALEMRGLDCNSLLQRDGRSPISVAPSMKLLPELFVGPLSDLIIAGVSTAPAENSLTLIFDPLTGKYVGNKKLNLNAGDRGLPRPDSAGTGAAPIGSRLSFESWNSEDASSRHNRTGSVGGQGSSGGQSTVPRVDRNLGDLIGRAFAMGSAEDESWMYNR
ncbi:hypothetical protein FRC04_001796, partial [Tulasnella sp. 424]